MLAGILHLSSQRGLYFAGFTLLPKLETAVIDSFAKQWYKLKIFFNCFFCTEGYQPHLVSNQWDLYLSISSETLRNIKAGTVKRKNHAQLLLQNLVIGRIQGQMSLRWCQLSVYQGGAEQVVTSPPSHDLLQDLTRKKPHCHAGSCHHFSQRDFRGEVKFNDFLFLAPCHYPLKHLYSMEVGSEEREKLQSKWHSWPPCLTEVVWKSPLSNNSIPAGSCKSPDRPRSPLISISISPCLFSNLYSQEAESPKQGKKYNSYPWTLTALLNMDLSKVFYLYAKTPYLFIFF